MKEKRQYKEEIEELLEDNLVLVLYNDDVNTFDHVIHALVTVCKHDPMEAEQCAYIVHTAGKCAVKYGTYEELEPKCSSLLDKGLSAKIE